MKLFTKIRKNLKKDEKGVALAEIMIAIVVIAILLIASAAAFTGAISANVTAGNRNGAIQVAQDVISVAKQAPFNRLATPVNSSNRPVEAGGGAIPDSDLCETRPWTGTFNGINIITDRNITTQYPGLEWCQNAPISGTNQYYTAYIYITPVAVTNAGTQWDNLDGAVRTDNNSAKSLNSTYQPKRITIIVEWFDQLTTNGQRTTQSITQSYVRVPTINECIPRAVYDMENSSPFNTACNPSYVG